MPHGRAGPESGAEAPREDCEMKCDRQCRFGDMILCYFVDAEQRVSMTLVPETMEGRVLEKEYRPEPLVQIHALGDPLPNGYGNGHTLADTAASSALKLAG